MQHQDRHLENFYNTIGCQFLLEMALTLFAREMKKLTQMNTIKEYIAEHAKICIQAPLTFETNVPCTLQMFMRNLNPYLYKLMNVGRCGRFFT